MTNPTTTEPVLERIVGRLKALEPGSVGEGGLEADARRVLRAALGRAYEQAAESDAVKMGTKSTSEVALNILELAADMEREP